MGVIRVSLQPSDGSTLVENFSDRWIEADIRRGGPRKVGWLVQQPVPLAQLDTAIANAGEGLRVEALGPPELRWRE